MRLQFVRVGLLGHFCLSSIISHFYLSLSLGDCPLKTELLSQRAVNQQTNEPTSNMQMGFGKNGGGVGRVDSSIYII